MTGSTAANELARNADLVIAVGTRLSGLHDRLAFALSRRPVSSRSTSMPSMRSSGARPSCIGDAATTLDGLSARLGGWTATAAWQEKAAREAEAWRATVSANRRRARGRAAGAALRRRGDRRGPALASAIGGARHRRVRGGHAARRAAQALARRAAGRLSHGIRLLLHGLRDRRRHRRQDGASGARGRRDGRRRQLPDAELGDRDLGDARHEARHRRAGQPRLRLHPPAAAGRAAARASTTCSTTACRARPACPRSTSRRTRARSARWPSTWTRSPSSRRRSRGPARPIARTSSSSTPIPCAPPRRAAGGGRSAFRKSPQRTRCAPRAPSYERGQALGRGRDMDVDVRIGINPISWTNDDLPALGGETPLATALTEGKAIGYEGFELGNKFPREPEALRAVLAQHGLACVSGWYSGRLARGTVADEIAAVERASRSPRGERRAGDGLRRGRGFDPGTPGAAVAAAAVRDRRRVVRLWRAPDGVRAAPPRPRRAPRVPSSHGRLCRDRGRRRPSDARDRPRGRVAARHRARHVRRRRRADRVAEARRARVPRALQGRAAARGADGAQSRLELPRRGAERRVQHAGRGLRRFRRGRRDTARCGLSRLARRRGRAGPGGRARVSLRGHGVPPARVARRRKAGCRGARRRGGGQGGGIA